MADGLQEQVAVVEELARHTFNLHVLLLILLRLIVLLGLTAWGLLRVLPFLTVEVLEQLRRGWDFGCRCLLLSFFSLLLHVLISG